MNRNVTVGVIVMIAFGLIGMAAITAPQSEKDALLKAQKIRTPSGLDGGGGVGLDERFSVTPIPIPRERLKASDVPIATSGDNVYLVWWTNKTGNDEVMFRASTDSGETFADKINLSNSTGSQSQDVEISAPGDSVIVTWWERNQTAEEPVVRISTDNGATFGPLLKLATNGTIGEEGG